MGNVKRVLLGLCLFLCSSPLWAPVSTRLNIEEQDGSPSTFPWKLKVSPGTLTDNGDGTATLTTGGGGGGGSSSLEALFGVARTSPTATINGTSPPFKGTVVGGTTMSFTIDPTSGTLQGNTFNGVSQLVQLDGGGKLPAIDGSQLTNLPGGSGGYAVEPASVTFKLNKGVSGSTTSFNAFNSTASSFTATGSGGLGVTYNVNAGSTTGSGLSDCTGAGKAATWASATGLFGCNSGFLTGNQSITISGDSSGSGTTSIAVTNAALQNNITTFGSSVTVNGSGGELVKYGINVGSMTGAGLATCGDSSHAVGWSSTNNLFTCQSITGSAGSPGGVNYNIQISSAGSFTGVSDMNVYSSSWAVTQHTTFLSTTTIDQGLTETNISTKTVNTGADLDFTGGTMSGSGSRGNDGDFWKSAGISASPSWGGTWEVLGSSSIVGSAQATTGAVTIAARDEIMIVVDIVGYGGADIASLRFNADSTAANYHARHINFSNAATPVLTSNNFTTGGNIQLGPTAITAGRSVSLVCTNFSTARKVCTINQQQEATAQATLAQIDLAYGEWFNTAAQITSVEMRTNAGNTMLVGSKFIVFGRNSK